jgi:hypothetical protein
VAYHALRRACKASLIAFDALLSSLLNRCA